MRVAALLVLLGCYAPHALPGSPCSATEPCPDPLVCSPTQTCEVNAVAADSRVIDSEPIDAPADAHVPDAPSFVQAAQLSLTPLANQLSLAYAAPITKQDLLVLQIAAGSGQNMPVSVADTLNNTFVLLGPFDSSPLHVYIAYTIAKSSGSDTVTVVLDSVPTSYFQLRLHEYDSVSTTEPFDTVASAAGTTAGTDAAKTTSFVTSAANELIFATCTFGDSGTAGTGFVRRTNLAGDVTEDMTAPTATSYIATATPNVATGWLIVAVAFRGR